PRATVRYRNAGVLRVLDRLLEGGCQAAENRGVQRLASGGSRRGCPATRGTEIEATCASFALISLVASPAARWRHAVKAWAEICARPFRSDAGSIGGPA